MLAALPSSELTEWMAFAALEPFGGAVDDMRAGLAPAVYVNAHKRDGAQPITPVDFYPWHERIEVPPVEESPEEVSRQLREMLNRITPR